MTNRPFKMLKVLLVALFALPVLSVVVPHSPAVAEPADRAEYVIMLRPGTGDAAERMGRQYGASHVYGAVFKGFSAKLNPQAAAALQRNPNVELIERALTVHKTSDFVPAGISRIEATVAHAQAAYGTGANVAIIDSGVQLNHPDLAVNINTALSRTFISSGSSLPNGDDDHGHGTHVAGTVAAALNGIGVVGVAPSATLISLKVLNYQGSGLTSDIIAAMDYITAHNNAASSYAQLIHVANCSFGGTGVSSTFQAAFDRCQASGCLVVAAAGNGSTNTSSFIPAAYASTFTVSAMDPVSDNFAWFSNYGAAVDMAAPGVSTYSTYIGSRYASMSGTSMAAPHVAGTAALFVGQNLATLSRNTAESTIRAGLLAAGEAIVLSGDPDGINEPLVNAAGVVGSTPPPPAPVPNAVHVSTTLNQPSYTTNDTQAVMTVNVSDETSAAITGLWSWQVLTAGATKLAYREMGNGAYEVTVDISAFAADVNYTVMVTVTDNRSVTGQDTVNIRRDSPTAPPVPNAVHVSTTLNQPSYTTNDTQAVMTVNVTDETSAAITGLWNWQVLTAGATKLAFREMGNGAYEVTVDISAFAADVNYSVMITVSDNRSVTGQDTVNIRRDSPTTAPPPPPPSTSTIYVSDISYSRQGPHVTVEVTIRSVEPNVDVSGVRVSITLNHNGSALASASALTDNSGTVSYRYKQARNGKYTTDIDDVSKSGLTYKPELNTADPGLTK